MDMCSKNVGYKIAVILNVSHGAAHSVMYRLSDYKSLDDASDQ